MIWMSFVNERLIPTFEKRKSNNLIAEWVKHWVTLNPNKVSPWETLRITMPKLGEEVVLVTGLLALHFNLNISGDAQQCCAGPSPKSESEVCQGDHAKH